MAYSETTFVSTQREQVNQSNRLLALRARGKKHLLVLRARFTTLVLGALLFACAGASGCKPKTAEGASGKTPDAWITYPVSRKVEEYEDFTGKTQPDKYVTVKPRATGHLKKVNFKDGDMVKENDVLFEIDPRQYQAALGVATSTLAQNEASLVQAQATLAQSKVRTQRLRTEFDRNRALRFQGASAISDEVLQKSEADWSESEAMVTSSEAAIEVAKAKVETAKFDKQTAEYNLAWCKVTADKIGGRIGKRLVDPGNVVEKEKTELAEIVKLDPMYATFDIDERTVLRLQKNVKDGKLLLDQNQKLKFKIGFADETGYSLDGIIDFVDNKIDTGTGTLRVRGTFDNTMFVKGTWPWERPTNYRLQPGLFIRVRLPVGSPTDSVLIPEKAIGTDQDKKFIYIINDKNEVKRRGIELGTLQEDGMRVIKSGLALGEKVVVTGLQRIRPDMVVEPKVYQSSSAK